MINEIKEKTDKILAKEQVLKQYETELDDLSKEIYTLEVESQETISFDLDTKLYEKKSKKAELDKRFKQAQEHTQAESKELARGLEDIARRYTSKRFKNDDITEQCYQDARDAMLVAYEKYKTYEQARKDLAKDIKTELDKVNYTHAAKYSDAMNPFSVDLYLMRDKPKLNLEDGDFRGTFTPLRFFENLEKNAK